ncbi:UDP-glucuronosyl/UDP-glucosyltransferase [Trinorchestia longiramus]|nr:UDP-glucuronosyl/UDP-glucosyltransferase [Trinorchestia longiramus]
MDAKAVLAALALLFRLLSPLAASEAEYKSPTASKDIHLEAWLPFSTAYTYFTRDTPTQFCAASVSVENSLIDCYDDIVKPPKTPSFDTMSSSSAKILILHPIYAGSHEVVLRDLGAELVRRGHFVTQLKWKSDHTPIETRKHFMRREAPWNVYKNLTWFTKEDRKENEGGRHCKSLDVITISPDNGDLRYPYMGVDGAVQPPTRLLWNTERSHSNIPTDVFGLIDAQCSTLLGDPRIFAALNSTGYTVAVVDLISNECSLALARLLGLPVVGYWGFPLQGGEARRLGMPQTPSIVPALMSELGYSMTFLERVYNSIISAVDELIVIYHFSVTDYWIKKFHPHLPSSSQLLTEMNKMMVSVSWHLDYPKLLPPHIYYIGCLTCTEGSSLDKELQEWVEGSGDAGVIIFSFGLTGFDSSVVPESFRRGALQALSRLQQRVVLHFDPAELPGLPNNVLARSVIPQQDLLAHPQTKLFVSHCGMNSVNEAVFHATPLLCVPNFADQGDITRRVLDRGFGLSLAKNDLTQETLYQKITEVISNFRYHTAVTQVSQAWRSEQSGTDAAVHLILQTHRSGLFQSYRPPGAHLNTFQYYCIDVICFLIAVIIASGLVLVRLCKVIGKNLQMIRDLHKKQD